MKVKTICSKLRAGASFALFCATVAVVAGCAGHREAREGLPLDVVAPRPPAFLIGPASVLLTNVTPFSALVTVDTVSTNKAHELSGQLLGEGTHLLFSATHGDRTFIWNTATRSGYVLSEALQGYAPFASPLQITNITTVSETAGPAGDRVNGHPGHEIEVSLAMSDGTTERFSVWRASDLNGFPVRIKTLDAQKPFELNITGIQPARLSETLFTPPDSFTKYSNPDVMGGELMVRRSKPKNTESTYFGEPQPILRNSMPH